MPFSLAVRDVQSRPLGAGLGWGLPLAMTDDACSDEIVFTIKIHYQETVHTKIRYVQPLLLFRLPHPPVWSLILVDLLHLSLPSTLAI